jgi:tetratricopeptide (TPR) repeat protein
MHFTSRSCLLIPAISIVLVAAVTSVAAQSQANFAAGSMANKQTTNKGTSAKAQADFSESIDPLSVGNFSDDELTATFDKMNASYSKNAVLYNNIGATFYSRKMYDKAEAALRRAIIFNNHPAFLTNLSILYDVQGKSAEAISAVQRAIAQAPRYARARNQLCELMLMSKRNADTLLCFDELSKLEPLDTLAQTYYALALVRSGDPEKAISMLSPLATSPEHTPLMFNILGTAYYNKKKYSRASDAFKEGVALDPDSSQLRFNLAISLTAVNDRAGALSQYNLMKQKDSALADQLYRELNRDKIIYVDKDGVVAKQK